MAEPEKRGGEQAAEEEEERLLGKKEGAVLDFDSSTTAASLFNPSVAPVIDLIKKKFNIKGGDSSFDDFVYHLICPSCTLCQESRTLEMNNVQYGMWHGRGDTICIGSFSEDTKAYLESSPQLLTMPKNSNDRVLLPASPPLIPPHVPV